MANKKKHGNTGNQNAKGNNGGRPNKFESGQFDWQAFAEEYGRGEGTLEELCEKYGISVESYYNYKNEYFEFFDAIKTAQERRQDRLKAMSARGMRKLLEGYEYTEQTTEIIPNGNGESEGDRPAGNMRKTIIHRKHQPPNATMIIFTKCNLEPEDWKSVQHIKHEGGREQAPLDYSQLSDDELKAFRGLVAKMQGKDEET